jgi:arylsulfatase A-like enzyme
MEGGMRVPMIVRWPGKIPAGTTSTELATMMDLLPTFCALTGATLPPKKLDGSDISGILLGTADAKSQYEALYYYRRRQLQAIRYGDWKYHLPLQATHPNWTSAKQSGPGRSGKLVNLKSDLQERTDVSAANPEVIKRMEELLKTAVVTLGNDEVRGGEQRDARTLDSSKSMTLQE